MLWPLFKRLIAALWSACERLLAPIRACVFKAQAPARTERVEKGGLPEKSSLRRVAIITVDVGSRAAPFLLNLFNGFSENDFFVLVVASRKLPLSLKSTLLAHCHVLLEGLSRADFWLGWEWIKHRGAAKEIELLALADDRFYYPRRISSIIGHMLAQNMEWQCLLENPHAFYEAHPSLQIIRMPCLQTIGKDETDIVRALFKAGLSPQACYNAARLSEDVALALANENIPADLHDVLNLALGFPRIDRNRRTPWGTKDALSLPPADVVQRIISQTGESDSAATIGLLCNYLYQTPINRDIGAHLLQDPAALLDLVQGFSAAEKNIMADDLRHAGISAQLARLRELPQKFRRAS